MGAWLVDFGTDSIRKYIDLRESTSSYLELKPEFLRKLQACIREREHYQEKIGVIKSVKDPQGKSVITPFCSLIISKTGLTVSFLGRIADDDSSNILGYWPTQFITVLNTDPNAISTLLYVIIEKPETVFKLELFFS
jgi:hypothetical protein